MKMLKDKKIIISIGYFHKTLQFMGSLAPETVLGYRSLYSPFLLK
jgi:hypothetical protein